MQNLQVISRQLGDRTSGIRAADRRAHAMTFVPRMDSASEDVDFEGLSSEVTLCIRELIGSSNEVIVAIASGKQSALKKALNEHMHAIGRHFEGPGVSGWVAGRCARQVLQQRSGMAAIPVKHELVNEILESLAVFYGTDRGQLRYRHWGDRPVVLPATVRLAHGERPVPLHQVMARALRGELNSTERHLCPWVVDMPLSPALVRSLVETCRDDLAQLLRFLGERTVVGYTRQARLMVNDTRRVLRVCRGTDDVELLKGASTVLVNATFSRIAEPDLIMRLLAAAPTSQLVNRVFGRPGEYFVRGVEGRGEAVAVGRAVASSVLADPDRYSVRVASRAAGFLIETEGSRTMPLFEERPELLELPS